MIFTRIT